MVTTPLVKLVTRPKLIFYEIWTSFIVKDPPILDILGSQ